MPRFILVGLPSLVLVGCTVSAPLGLPDPVPYTAPADPSVATDGTHYHSVVGEYTPRMPTEPEGWRGMGVEMAPVGEDASPEGAQPDKNTSMQEGEAE